MADKHHSMTAMEWSASSIGRLQPVGAPGPVLVDSGLAALYHVETKALTRAVRRNAGRFPGDLMFQLAAEESDSSRFGSAVAGRSPEIGFSPISLHAPFLRNGNTSPESRDLLATTWVGTSIRMVLVQTPARFPRRTLRQREIRSVGRQKTRPTERSRGRTARRSRRYRHRVPAIHTRRAFITIHCDDLSSIKGAIPGVWVRPGC